MQKKTHIHNNIPFLFQMNASSVVIAIPISHSMCLEAFNFGWLNSYVYCWNDQKKFHYRVLFYFCIMLGEVMMLAMNARKKIPEWSLVSEYYQMGGLSNWESQSSLQLHYSKWLLLLFYSLLIVIPQKMMKSETFSLEIESGCANTCCLAASKYKFRQLSQVI